MDESKFLKEDAIRKANRMSEGDRLDFLMYAIDQEQKTEIQQKWKDSANLRNCILVACCFLLFFIAFLT